MFPGHSRIFRADRAVRGSLFVTTMNINRQKFAWNNSGFDIKCWISRGFRGKKFKKKFSIKNFIILSDEHLIKNVHITVHPL